MKYYVQSGNLKTTITAENTKEACLLALEQCFNDDLVLDEHFLVSETSFILDREPFSMSTNEESYPSTVIFADYASWIEKEKH